MDGFSRTPYLLGYGTFLLGLFLRVLMIHVWHCRNLLKILPQICCGGKLSISSQSTIISSCGKGVALHFNKAQTLLRKKITTLIKNTLRACSTEFFINVVIYQITQYLLSVLNAGHYKGCFVPNLVDIGKCMIHKQIIINKCYLTSAKKLKGWAVSFKLFL